MYFFFINGVKSQRKEVPIFIILIFKGLKIGRCAAVVQFHVSGTR